ncbi:MAG: metallophosphoesterase [Desulfobulbus sp.]
MQPVIVHDGTPYERILAVADIHGGHTALAALLAEVQPGWQDLFVTLGDYIDRGPDSRQVLAELRQCANYTNTVCLRGNHEGMFLLAMSPAAEVPDLYDNIPGTPAFLAENIRMWLGNGGLETLASYCQGAGAAVQKSFNSLKKVYQSRFWFQLKHISTGDALIEHCAALAQLIPPEDFAFMRTTCVDALASRQHIFVHGGYDPQQTLDKQRLFTLHWARPPDVCAFMDTTLVVGHQIMRNRLPKDIGSLLYLDTGSSCVVDGRLTCMDVQTREFWQADQAGRICHSGKLTPIS